MVVMWAKYCTLAAYELLTCLAEVYERTFMMDAVTILKQIYAGATGVWDIEEISDCASGTFLDLVYFLVGVLEPSFYFPLEASLPLDLDFDADLSDFLSSYFFALVSLLFLLF